uniref:Uncharacterized protein n=1 Tax=Chromera velia CCMP2878 TaxID=1169474 RepID=A0A0G4GH06_9ALVE|eukprot:Cvel_21880.t1-p1 / transcript=Cvel_21880.t1 / gene=Cvel_21880 / organism=Chromera_velia_CCMP2878 / gene_product=hypothetical protein / transcript_product=hypothetical protein / location=Cvel_scaffold2092:14752-15183(+) / protein_length=144 / sequence_SO=supercontig / SO=protein_coding / is_pseudo=false
MELVIASHGRITEGPETPPSCPSSDLLPSGERRGSAREAETGGKLNLLSPVGVSLCFPLEETEKGKGDMNDFTAPRAVAVVLGRRGEVETRGTHIKKKNVEPVPRPSDLAPTMPPQCASTNILEMHRPKPVPPPLCNSPALIYE